MDWIGLDWIGLWRMDDAILCYRWSKQVPLMSVFGSILLVINERADMIQSLWSPYVIGQTIIFSFCFFFLSSSCFFHRLISAVGDWMFTILRHMVWP